MAAARRSPGRGDEAGDHLADGPQHVDLLSQRMKANPAALFRLMRAMANAGFFTESPAKTSALTAVGQPSLTTRGSSCRFQAGILQDECFAACLVEFHNGSGVLAHVGQFGDSAEPKRGVADEHALAEST